MIDIKDIVPEECDLCGKTIAPTYSIMDRDETFCSYKCAELFVIEHNVDEAERKGEK